MRSVRGDGPWIWGGGVWSNGRSLWIQDAKELKSSGLSSVGSGGVRNLGLSAVGQSRRNQLCGEVGGLAPDGHPGGHVR